MGCDETLFSKHQMKPRHMAQSYGRFAGEITQASLRFKPRNKTIRGA